MRLTVRARITLVMSVLVLVNMLTASVSWWSFQQASRYSRVALEAAERARLVEITVTRLTQYVADSRALAFTVSHSAESEDSSVDYGRLQGSESAVDAAIASLDDIAASESATEWNELRTTTYLWINREAAAADSPFRMTRDAAGRYRASVTSNLKESGRFAAMSNTEMSREVRDQAQVFGARTLRRMATAAERESRAAAEAERAARDRAVLVSVIAALIGVVVALLGATWLYRSIAVPLAQARSFADRVAGGDLAATFSAHRSDEIGALTREVVHMKDSVVQRIATMREMAGAVMVTAETLRAEAEAADVPEVVEGTAILLGLSEEMLNA